MGPAQYGAFNKFLAKKFNLSFRIFKYLYDIAVFDVI